MSNKDYNVYQGADGLWRGKRQNADRSAVVSTTQREAIQQTRALVQKTKGELSVHRADNGRVREKWSYGNDPKNIKG
ncbi:DUF2188 domain-containing protein [Budviciaceae bacterium BWR-B9]|uniref:DUF2188 domain-containing protein n=1 Tax=Limnobaculum allomyrinae TaxID=2791986 RepID=A0ABS1IVY5_9GAMM|nr:MULTISPECIES: DUF2188 domain-containing protein [Limnobaculum]MBK5145925.1 DUF2188 domain-containing protein [Limnobaculum allomyrinae]MBV7694020.1 DUF2188 domain-containing protein [Limnobaculum sp. M2-1]